PRNRLPAFAILDAANCRGRARCIRLSWTAGSNERRCRWHRHHHHAGAVASDVEFLGHDRDTERIEPRMKDSQLEVARRQAIELELAERVGLRRYLSCIHQSVGASENASVQSIDDDSQYSGFARARNGCRDILCAHWRLRDEGDRCHESKLSLHSDSAPRLSRPPPLP